MFDRIVFTTDITRVQLLHRDDGSIHCLNFGEANVDFFSELIGDSIRQVSSVPMSRSFRVDGGQLPLSVITRLIEDARNSADPVEIGRRFWADNYEVAAPGLLDQFVADCQGALVIGFELSPAIMRRLDACSTAFLNIRTHPLRFLSDLSHILTTNRPELIAGLGQFELRDPAVRSQTSLFKAALRKRGCVSSKQLSNAAVVFSQTWHDQFVIRERKHTRYEDYFNILLPRLREHEWTFICPHPYNRDDLTSEINLLQMLDHRAEIRLVSGYALLAQPGVTHAYCIGSSIVAEAEAFGLQSTFLNRHPGHVIAPDAERAAATFCKHFVNPRMWRQLLANASAAMSASDTTPEFIMEPNQIRTALNVDWGLGRLMAEGFERPIIVDGRSINRIYDSSKLDASQPNHTQEVFRLLWDKEANEVDSVWHEQYRASRHPCASIDALNEHNRKANNGHVDLTDIKSLIHTGPSKM